jgi:hypothetical protein
VYLSDTYQVHSGLEQWNALSPLPSNFAVEFAIRKFQEKQEREK